MNIKITGVVKHNKVLLKTDVVYEMKDSEAQKLIDLGQAVLAGAAPATPEPESTPREPVDPSKPYVGEAEPTRDLKPEEVDDKPVVPPTPEVDTPAVGTETPEVPVDPAAPATPETPADETPADPNAPVDDPSVPPTTPSEPEK